MSNAKHTPGSLRCSHAVAEWMGENWSDEFHDRMASMIERHTAASELLEALKGLIDMLENQHKGTFTPGDRAARIIRGRAAIAKAEGGAE